MQKIKLTVLALFLIAITSTISAQDNPDDFFEHSGSQLYIKSETYGSNSNDWPHIENNNPGDGFNIREIGERGGRDLVLGTGEEAGEIDDRSEYEADESRCEIYWHDTNGPFSEADNEATLRTYEVGTKIDEYQDNFRHGNEAYLDHETSTHKWEKQAVRENGRRVGEEWGEAPAFDLMNEMSTSTGGTGLDGQPLDADKTGELRITRPKDPNDPLGEQEGVNRLKGQLICASPEPDDEYNDVAKWQACSRHTPEKRVKAGETVYECSASPTGRAGGDWEKVSEETIRVYFYETPPTGIIGFHIPGTQVEKWENVYGTVSYEEDEVTVKAECWQGTEAQRPENPSSIANISKGLTTNGVNRVATQLPERSWENHDKDVGQNKYSCNYGFQQRYGADLLIDTVHESYIVQGSDLNGPISTQEYLVSAPSSDALQTAADNTQTDNTPFEHFPGENDVLGSGVKDPFDVWKDNYVN